MYRLLSIVFGLLLGLPVSAAEMDTRTGDIYATVDVKSNGDIEVVKVVSDLPEDMNPRIEEWLQRQAIHLAATAETEAPNRTTLHIGYTLVDSDSGGRGLVMTVKGTGVGVPAEVQTVAAEDTEISVRVRVLADGSVAEVTPVQALPAGVNVRDIEQAVRADIENDEVIQRAAQEGSLEEGIYTIIVRSRPVGN